MNYRRLEALQQRQASYQPDGRGRCSKHLDANRWTGSGLCCDCHPKRRGTQTDAMNALFGPEAIISQQVAIARRLPLFRDGWSCKHGHAAGWRRVYMSACMECVADTVRQYNRRGYAEWRERRRGKVWQNPGDILD